MNWDQVTRGGEYIIARGAGTVLWRTNTTKEEVFITKIIMRGVEYFFRTS
ncbi:unnamed protein product [Rhodiola kirilowii]